jgi:hypothetical protein
MEIVLPFTLADVYALAVKKRKIFRMDISQQSIEMEKSQFK